MLSWFAVAPSCPSCGLHLDRDEPGYWIGSYTINLFITEGVLAVALLAGILLAWPAVPWTALTIVGCGLAVGVPVLVFPHTKLLYLAIDLALRPAEPPDMVTPQERSLVAKP